MKRNLLALPLMAALAACGGGGGDVATTDPTTQLPSIPPATGAGLVTDVPVPTYTIGSEELAAFNLLNQERSACGFGKLAQNTLLDNASRGHADWIAYNAYPSHFQVAGTPLFTGVTPQDRVVAAGYNPAGGFEIQDEYTYSMGTFGNDKSGFGTIGIRRLLNAPYHAGALTDGFREVGISVRNAFDSGAPDAAVADQGRKVLVINPARTLSSGSQMSALASNDVLTYPCEGTTGVEPGLYAETPEPVPGRDLLTNPLGSSVQVAVKEGQTLTITSASMRVAATGTPVTLRTPVTSANDPHPGYFKPNRGYIVADAPLAENTTYTVTINGTNNGVAFPTKTFSFTTGMQSEF